MSDYLGTFDGVRLRRGHAYLKDVRHDDWCRYFTTKNPDDCNCDPDVVILWLNPQTKKLEKVDKAHGGESGDE